MTEQLWRCPMCQAIHEGKPVYCDECGHRIRFDQRESIIVNIPTNQTDPDRAKQHDQIELIARITAAEIVAELFSDEDIVRLSRRQVEKALEAAATTAIARWLKAA